MVLNEKTIIKPRKEDNTTDLFVFKKHIIFQLLELGLKKAPKWNRAIIPKQFMKKNYKKYVLKGYFDTDGSVVHANNGGKKYPRLEMKISPSPMQEEFIEIFGSFDFNHKIYDIGKGKIKIQMNGKKQLKKWKNCIGFSNQKHINRANLFL